MYMDFFVVFFFFNSMKTKRKEGLVRMQSWKPILDLHGWNQGDYKQTEIILYAIMGDILI